MARFFISSTSNDLKDYRTATSHALRQLRQEVVDMAEFVATDATAVEKCMKDVDDSDAYVGIFAWRYGHIPPEVDPDGKLVNPEHISITEMEYRRAVARKKRRLAFLVGEDVPWPPTFMEEGEGREKIRQLRKTLEAAHIVSYFSSPADLAALVTAAAHDIITEIDRDAVGTVRSKPRIAPPGTAFFGGEDKVVESTELLSGETRLVTLTGPPGIGKSRIAHEIAFRIQDSFADGACLVTLENVLNADEMVNRIAGALKVSLAPPPPSVHDQVWDFHRDRHFLVLLDNVDSLPLSESGSVISDLLDSCARVQILATSQAALRLGPERNVEIEPMNPAACRQFFRDRVQASAINSKVIANDADVDAICEKLEWVPLAVELAASLMNNVAPKQLLKRLTANLLNVLEVDPGARTQRHAALRAAIETSYSRLSARAQKLLPLLSVFKGGFTADAVEAISDPDPAMAPLNELRNHSLLRSGLAPGAGVIRFGMLESIRQFSAEKFSDAGANRRHAEFYATYFCDAARKLRTIDESDALLEAEPELDNAAVAMTWLREHDAVTCARLALPYQQFLRERGRWEEALSIAEAGVEAIEKRGEGASVLGISLAYRLGSLLHDFMRLDEALTRALSALEAARSTNNVDLEAALLNLIGLLRSDGGDADAGDRLFREALELCPLSAHQERGKILSNLARLETDRGNAAAARKYYSECLMERDLAGDLRGKALTLGNLGALEQAEHHIDEAEARYLQSLAIRRQLKEDYGIAIMLNNLAEIARLRGEETRALTFYVHADRILTEIGSPVADVSKKGIAGMAADLGEEVYGPMRRDVEPVAWESLIDAS